MTTLPPHNGPGDVATVSGLGGHTAPPAAFFYVVQSLEQRFGADAGITLADLAMGAGVQRREVEQVIEEHLEDFPFVVCAGAHGYFRPINDEELNHYYLSLRSRAKCLFLRMAITRRSACRDGWTREGGRFVSRPQQLEMFA